MTNILLIFYFFLSIILLFLITNWYYKRVGRIAHYLSKCPSLPRISFLGSLPILAGSVVKALSVSPEQVSILLLQEINGLATVFTEIFVFWIGWNPLVILYRAQFIEVVLSSNKLIEKSVNYNFLHPWLGRGLLTNTGEEWRSRRKLLTPTFHFKIIDDFIPIISEHSMTFVERLKTFKGQAIDINPLVTACTLDIIGDTAMGVKINAQKDTNSEYVRAIYALGEAFMYRNVDPKGWFDFIFFRTAYGKNYLKSLNTLHEFTRKVIKERKEEILRSHQNKSNLKSANDLGLKKRMAFLNLLLEYHLSSDSQLSEEDIREEVDTFMFEGHDTTAMAICWTLLLIGLDPEIQETVHKEIDDIFSDDKSRAITGADIIQLKYLECCIKESLRLFPSVPAIARLVTEDFQLGSYLMPKGATLLICPYILHRDKEVFPQPELFKPERFMGKISETRINPYAYVPFSAGPRNCIGQKFALTEEKIVLANLFRNFKIKSKSYRDSIKISMELVTRPRDPVLIEFIPK